MVELFAPQTIARPSRGWSYGYGTMIHPLGEDGPQVIEHGGAMSGFVAWLRWMPEADVTIVLLSNSRGSRITRVADDLTRLALPTSGS